MGKHSRIGHPTVDALLALKEEPRKHEKDANDAILKISKLVVKERTNAFVEARANGFLVSFSMEERFEERVEEYTHTYATIICHHRYYNTQTFYRATSSFNLFF
jgi:hypothetical protein